MSIPNPQPLRKFVRAGAGAGKTWNLTREVVKLAQNFHQQTGQWPKTVLTTFTRKATQELKERMLLYCLDEKPEAIEFVQSTSFLKITTMHGLLSQFLSHHGYGLGLPNQIKIADGATSAFWRKQVLRQMLTESRLPVSLQVFDFQILLELLASYEPIYWRGQARPLQKPEEFSQVLQDWLKPMGQNLGDLLEEARTQYEGEKVEAYLTHLQSLVQCLLSETPWEERYSQLQSYFPLPHKPRKSKTFPGFSEDFKKAVDDCIDEIKKAVETEDASPRYWSQMANTLKDFSQFADEFMGRLIKKKQEEGSLEPNDLEFFSLKALREQPELIRKFSDEIDAWFIDEFQDTSPLQMEILEPMIGSSSCYIVGDPQQSIYLFRGSRSEVFFEKGKKMQAEGADMAPLQDNYRSQEHLLKFFNDLFPAVDPSFSAMNPKVEPIHDQAAVQITQVTSDEKGSELHHLTEELAALIKRGVLAKDICILTRTHKQSDELQKTLMSLGFPVISHSSDAFYRRREVIDGFSLLKFLVNPWDDRNLLTLLRSPWMGLSDQEIVQVIGEHSKSFWPSFREYFRSFPEDHPGALLLKGLQRLNQDGYAWVFRRLVMHLGLLEYSHRIDTTGRREANLWKLINIIERNAREPGASLLQLIQQGELSTTLENFSEAGDASSPVEPNKIHLMTVHASKGLQFDHVFIPFMEKKPQVTNKMDFIFDEDLGLWSFRMPLADPTKSSGGPIEKKVVDSLRKKEREESQRLLYVAMTRAKTNLYLSWSGKPKDLSWAQVLVQHESIWHDNPQVKFKEVQQQEPFAHVEAFEEAPLQVPFSERVQRFAEPEIEATDSIPFHGDWSAMQKGQQRRREGVVLHRVFETLKNHSASATKEFCKSWLPGRESDVVSAIDFVMHTQPLPALIATGEVEWGYQKLQGGAKLERRIDLWGVHQDTLWIVDYKTGTTQNRDQAFAQMREYGETLKDFLNWDKEIQLMAVYPFSRKTFIETM